MILGIILQTMHLRKSIETFALLSYNNYLYAIISLSKGNQFLLIWLNEKF